MIRMYPDMGILSLAAARLVAEKAKNAVESRGEFIWVLSGGHSPLAAYKLLSQTPFSTEMPWQRFQILWSDERCVPATDPRSNALQARLLFLDQVPVPSKQIHPISCNTAPEQAAEEYEAFLHSFLGDKRRLDLVFLGLGRDGHIASVFPGSPMLDEYSHWVTSLYRSEEDLCRVSLTPALINLAREVVFLVYGSEKAEALYESIVGRFDPRRWPAQMIHPENGELTWLVDYKAAEYLIRKSSKTGKNPECI